MKPVAIHSNVVYLYEYDILDTFKIEEVQEKVKVTYSQSPDLATASIPGQIKMVSSQAKNLQVAAQGHSLIVTDTNLNESNSWLNTDFLLVAYAVKDIFTAVGLKKYGFNFQFSMPLNDPDTTVSRLKEKFFKENIFGDEREAKFVLPSLSYVKNNKQYVFSFGLELTDDNKAKTLNVTAGYIVAQGHALPATAQDFIDLYKETYSEAYKFIEEQL